MDKNEMYGGGYEKPRWFQKWLRIVVFLLVIATSFTSLFLHCVYCLDSTPPTQAGNRNRQTPEIIPYYGKNVSVRQNFNAA